MTLFSVLLKLSGLSLKEASDFFDVRIDTVKSWSAGRNGVPGGVLGQLHDLLEKQEKAAGEAVNLWNNQGEHESLECGVASDDYEAQQLGWPSVGAQMAMYGRLWEMLHGECELSLVPRGSTIGTAAPANNFKHPRNQDEKFNYI